MFRFSLVVITALAVTQVGLSLALQKCTRPEGECDVNFKKASGKWYCIINQHMEVDTHGTCFALNILPLNENEAYFIYRDYHMNLKTYGEMPVHVMRSGKATYFFDNTIGENWSTELKKDNNFGENVRNVMREAYSSDITMVTDYENYLMLFICSSKGYPIIWTLGRRPHPTANDALLIRNKLIQIGRRWQNVHLYPSICNKIADYEAYRKEVAQTELFGYA